MREHERPARPSEHDAAADVAADSKMATEKSRISGAELDDLLDRIDDLLEKNAKEFVANYVQHGGE